MTLEERALSLANYFDCDETTEMYECILMELRKAVEAERDAIEARITWCDDLDEAIAAVRARKDGS